MVLNEKSIVWNVQQKEGQAGVEPATYRAATNCSTTELLPHVHIDCVSLLYWIKILCTLVLIGFIVS